MSDTRRAGASLLALLQILTIGCASLVNGRTQVVEITSAPASVRAVILPGNLTISTPAEVELARKQAHTVRFEREGCGPQAAYLDRVTTAVGYWDAFLLGLAFGLTGTTLALREFSTGAAYRLTPDPLHVEIEPCARPAADP